MKPNKKERLVGDTKLIPTNHWLPFDTMCCEDTVLNNPIFDDAFDGILKKFKPTNEVCFLSLCTKVRPYQSSRKWSIFLRELSGLVDFVVCSNGGIIPKPFWGSYPFLNYDAPRLESGEFDDLYKSKFKDRLSRFLKTHRYKYVVANFRTNQRNYEPAKEVLTDLKESGYITDYSISPDDETYLSTRTDETALKLGLLMYPDAHPVVINQFTDTIKKWNVKTNRLPL